WLFLATVGWIGAIGAGEVAMWRHANSPGPVGRALPDWPQGIRIPLASDRPTLIFFAHPKCPCTRASLGELATVLSGFAQPVDGFALFYKPRSVPDDWARTESRRRAEAIKGLHVAEDDGALARRFGARTSGHVVIYGPDGRLRFRGGLVGSRGEVGDSPARRA